MASLVEITDADVANRFEATSSFRAYSSEVACVRCDHTVPPIDDAPWVVTAPLRPPVVRVGRHGPEGADSVIEPDDGAVGMLSRSDEEAACRSAAASSEGGRA